MPVKPLKSGGVSTIDEILPVVQEKDSVGEIAVPAQGHEGVLAPPLPEEPITHNEAWYMPGYWQIQMQENEGVFVTCGNEHPCFEPTSKYEVKPAMLKRKPKVMSLSPLEELEKTLPEIPIWDALK
jgi:hypothetical protein